LCDGVTIVPFGLTFSRVGFAVFSIQVNIVWVSTELKTSAWACTMIKSVHMSRIQYDALSVRNSDMVRANVKGNLNVLSAERKITRTSIVRTIRSAPIVVLNPGKHCLSFN
jgi:hypothetical protein